MIGRHRDHDIAPAPAGRVGARFAAIGLAAVSLSAAGQGLASGAGDSLNDSSAHPVWSYLATKYDQDGDGKITAEEHGRSASSFELLDKNKDHVISEADFLQQTRGVFGSRVLHGKDAKKALDESGPAVGQVAPDFSLKRVSALDPADSDPADRDPADGTSPGESEVTLSSWSGRRPVALVFGSYTSPRFRKSAGRLMEIFNNHQNDVQFYVVYIREAHAIDSPIPLGGANGAPIVEDPTSWEERAQVAKTCLATLDLEAIPAVVDDVDDVVKDAYKAWPDRLFLIGKDGKIAFKGAVGPLGFKPDELAAAIAVEVESRDK